MKTVSWYFHQNLKPQGPLTLEEIRTRIHRGEIGPQHLISNSLDDQWKPASAFVEFEASLFPAHQGLSFDKAPLLNEKEWVLLVPAADGKGVLQEGPFSLMDLFEGLQSKTVSGQQFIWKTGLSGWCRIQDRPEFEKALV